jgi:hypothetical protein
MIIKYEKRRWLELDKRINSQIEVLLIFIYNILFLHMKKMEEWIEVNNSKITRMEKN